MQVFGANGTHKSKLLKGSGLTFLSVFIWELVEEGLENLIAFTLTSAVVIFATKAVATIFATQLIKISFKKAGKMLMPVVKSITYKEGNDKMSKVKKFFTWIFANKKTLIGTIGALFTSIATAYGTYGGYIDFLPIINVFGFNLTALIIGIVCFVLVELGVTGKGFETIQAFFARKKVEEAENRQKAIIKQAEKELKAEEKIANQTQAQKEKEEAKKQAEQKAKAEKDKAEAAHRAEIDKAKAELKKQNKA